MNDARISFKSHTVRLLAIAAVAALSTNAHAQSGRWEPASEIPRGTTLAVRTSEPISVNTADGQIFKGVVDNDVSDTQDRVVILRGSEAELIVRHGANDELMLDLDSILINGHRYAVDTVNSNAVGTSGSSTIGVNKRTGEYIGGGALLGAIIGAAAGGGKGAAIGAGVGAAAGAGVQVATRGTNVNVPVETVLTYRLDTPLHVDIADTGYEQNGRHYHRYPR
jgi:hypothetical protein